MKRAILGLPQSSLTDGAGDRDLATDTSGDTGGIVVERTQYLDGKTIWHGEAATTLPAERVTLDIGGGSIETDTVSDTRVVVTDWYADFDAGDTGFVGVDSSAGTFVWDWLVADADLDTDIVRAEFDLDGFAEQYDRDGEGTGTGSVWQIGYGGDDASRVGVRYHDDAQLRTTDVTQLGFDYRWNGLPVRGTVAASGYVCVFSPLGVDEFGRWLRDELLPFAHLPDTDTEQETLSDDQPETCDECGREPEREIVETSDGRDLCIVCHDKESERGVV